MEEENWIQYFWSPLEPPLEPPIQQCRFDGSKSTVLGNGGSMDRENMCTELLLAFPGPPRSGFYAIPEEIYCAFEDMRDLY